MSSDTSSSGPALRGPRSLVRLSRAGRSTPWRRVSSFAPLAVLVVLMISASLVDSVFLTVGSLQAVAVQAAIIFILSAGQTFVILIGRIDLSVASLTSFCTVLLALWLPGYGFFAVVLVVLAAGAAGAAQGYVHAKTQVPSFIVTLGGLGLWHSLGLKLSHASTLSLTRGFGSVSWLDGQTLRVPNAALAALVIAGIGTAAFHWLPIGRYIVAIGGAERAALLSSVRATVVRVSVFAVSGVSAALAACVLVAQQESGSPSLADGLLLPSLAAVVIGGTAITGGSGGLQRTIVGALIISVLRIAMGIMGIDPLYEQILYGGLLIVTIIVATDRSKLVLVK